MEKEVTLRCRRKDEKLVDQLLVECLNELKKDWGGETKVIISYNRTRMIKYQLPTNYQMHIIFLTFAYVFMPFSRR